MKGGVVEGIINKKNDKQKKKKRRRRRRSSRGIEKKRRGGGSCWYSEVFSHSARSECVAAASSGTTLLQDKD